jgi:NAD-dependent DNA ligase
MKDARITKTRKLKFFAYDLANFDEFIKTKNIDKYYDVIKNLEKLGFDVSSYFLKLSSIKEVIKAIDNF